MKKAWYSTFEGLEAPVVVYFISMILLGIGNTFTSTSALITTILQAMGFTGGLIKTLFPLYLVINIIGKRHEDSVPLIGGIIGYLVMTITTKFFVIQSLPDYYYMDITKALETERLNSLKEHDKDEVKASIIESIMRHGIREKEARELWNMGRNTEDCVNRLAYAEEETSRNGHARSVRSRRRGGSPHPALGAAPVPRSPLRHQGGRRHAGHGGQHQGKRRSAESDRCSGSQERGNVSRRRREPPPAGGEEGRA